MKIANRKIQVLFADPLRFRAFKDGQKFGTFHNDESPAILFSDTLFPVSLSFPGNRLGRREDEFMDIRSLVGDFVCVTGHF